MKWVLVAVVVVLLLAIYGLVMSFWEKFREVVKKLWELCEQLVEVNKKLGGYGSWFIRNYKLLMFVVALLALLVAVAMLVLYVYRGNG